MPRNCNNLQMRIGGRNVFFDNDHQESEREVRMAGDTIMAGIRPRISFKQDTRIGNRKLEFALKNCFADDDLRMSLNNNGDFLERNVMQGRGRNNFGKMGSNSHIDLRNKLTQVVLADANWYRITIPCGANFGKDFIINKILDFIAPETFVPILYQHQERSATFYVDDCKTAKKLLSCDDRVYLNDKFRLHVYVRPGYAQCKVDDILKEKIALVIKKRYNQEANALDLSRLHQDPDLAEGYFCAMYQPTVLTTVLEIAMQLVPQLQALNLDGNKFSLIERLGCLQRKFKNLKILHLGDNLLKDVNLVDPLKHLHLEELRLSGNPLCHNYSLRQDEYVRELRSRFPKLLRLDAIELPPPISFDVVEEGLHIPPSLKMFSSNLEITDIASRFLEQYFLIFDSQRRQDLMSAYHENAVFSMTVASYLGARPNSYLGESRNLLKVNDLNRRRKMLRRGRLNVVSRISEFPPTKHVSESFTMDASLCSESMMLVTVTGLFKETNNSDTPFRYFNRALVIVPEGTGYCILNEQFCIHNATQLQQKRAMNKLLNEEVTMAIQEPVIDSRNEIVSSSDDYVKLKMVEELSQETHMNMSWSQKCLNEVQWNYGSALSAFEQFFKQGLIPAEAFDNSL